MKNKNNVYVEVESKEQAETYRKVLEAMGESIAISYKPENSSDNALFLTEKSDWICFEEAHCIGMGRINKITFGELIDLLQRKPLLISEDGVELFEGDFYSCIKNINDNGWKYCFDHLLGVQDFVITDSLICKAFSTKQAALEWIESQKPKKKVIEIGKGLVFIVTKDSVKIDYQLKGGCAIEISNEKIKEVAKALEDLQNG